MLLGCHDIEWSVSGSLFTSLRFHCGTKGSALCGVFLPSTPPWSDLALLCAAALRYSSLMFQVPLWTSTKACVHPLWSSRAPSPPVRCCLPAPCLPSWCWCSCVCVLFCPSFCCPLSLFLLPLFSGALTSFGCSLSLCRCSRVFFLCLGASVPFSALNLFCVVLVLLIDCGPRRSSLLSPCACPPCFGVGAVSVVLGVCCCWLLFWLFFVCGGCFCQGSRTRPEPWTGPHCSELHWRWPVEFSALLSRAPVSSKVCTHGSFSRIQQHCKDGTLDGHFASVHAVAIVC